MLKLEPVPKLELIDTLWNVNKQNSGYVQIQTAELIDTLWNVNQKDEEVISHKKLELIDTLWNVNLTRFHFLYTRP